MILVSFTPFCVFSQLPIIMLVAFSMCIVCLLMAGKILCTLQTLEIDCIDIRTGLVDGPIFIIWTIDRFTAVFYVTDALYG